MKKMLIFAVFLAALPALTGCFILGQAIYDEDDCRLYYIYREDPNSGRKSLEWESSYCGAGGGLTRMQWDAKYEKLREEDPEGRYSQSIFEYSEGANYTFDELQGFVLQENLYGW